MPYDDMDDIEKLPDMAHVLRKTAFMNVQKFPAGTTTNNRDIEKASKEHKEILLEQIATYKPDIIIGGNTISYFIEDLGLNNTHKDYDENE
jgi:ABC-type Fe3+-hydroxamate transport system substrate-binding protein